MSKLDQIIDHGARVRIHDETSGSVLDMNFAPKKMSRTVRVAINNVEFNAKLWVVGEGDRINLTLQTDIDLADIQAKNKDTSKVDALPPASAPPAAVENATPDITPPTPEADLAADPVLTDPAPAGKRGPAPVDDPEAV